MELHKLANAPSVWGAEVLWKFPPPPPPVPAFGMGMLSLPTFFLLLLLLPGVVPSAAAQPALSLQPSGVLTKMGHTVPTDMYLDSPETGGMNGVRDVALSGDLLFATEFSEDILSVWRVNAETGTFSRIVRYRDNTGGIDGLDGALNVAVSDDGKLLFVTADEDDALSVWRVNASSGTLEQTALYQDLAAESTITEVDGRADGLDGARDVAVSGQLLFVTADEDDTLSVWRVNASSGTLEQTALYQDSDVQDDFFNYIENVDGRFDGLNLAEGIAVSGKLLFVTAHDESALSVWQVNAEAGTLTQTGFYQRLVAGEPSSGPAGLIGAWGVALSGDGNLLFVTAGLGEFLSVWRVNAEEGTLTQTALYQDPEAVDKSEIAEVDGQVDGLLFPIGVAVSGDLLFVAGHIGGTLSVWQVNAETGTLTQTALYQDPRLEELVPIAEVDSQVDGLNGAFNIAVQNDLLFVTVFDVFNRRVETGLSVWHINNAEVSLEMPTVISVRLDLPVEQEVMVTVTAQSGARMKAVTATVTFSPGMLSRDAIFPAGALGLGRWIFTAQADPPTVLDTGAARIAMQVVVVPLLSLELRQERFATGNTLTLTVRASAALQIAAPYRIIARRLDLPSVPEVDFAVTHPAGSTEVMVSIPSQSLPTGQWEFSIQLPERSSFQVGDSVTAFISTAALSLQPSGVLIKMGHAVPTEVYFDSPETGGLGGVRDVAVSGDLLFVTAFFDDTLSVWRVNAEAGILRQTVRYRNNIGEIDGLDGAAGVAVSDDGKLLFVTAVNDDALSVWRVNEAAEILEQTEVYLDDEKDSEEGIDGLNGANDVAVSDDGKLLFVTARDDNALSVWRVNAEAGTLRRTALYLDEVGLREVASVAVSDDGSLLFVTAFLGDTLSVWQVNAEAGTLTRTALYQNSVGGIDGLNGAAGVAVSGDLLFVTGSLSHVLSVWQVNAEAGTLTQTVLYRDRIDRRRGVPVDGLYNPRGVAISGDLLFATGFLSDALSVWQVNAEAGTLRQTALYQDSGLDPMDRSYIAEVDSRVDGLNGAFNIAVSGDLLFVTGFDAGALSAWHINNAAVSLEVPTVVSVRLDIPMGREVMVTVTAQSGARMKAVTATVTFSPGMLSRDAIFPAGALGLGRWIFTAQADPPTVLETEAARIAVQVVELPLLSLELRQEQFAVGNTVILTVRASAALQVAASYRIIARRIGLPSVPKVDSAFTYPAGSTEVTVPIPGQSLSTGQWEFSIQLPGGSPFRVGDSVTAFISTPRILILQPSGVLIKMEHAVLTEVYSDSAATDGLQGVGDVAISGDGELLFVIGTGEDALSVWRVNAEAGTLRQNALYRDDSPDDADRIIEGLVEPSDVEVSDDLLFVVSPAGNKLSVWRVSKQTDTLRRIVTYKSGTPHPDDPDRLILSLSGVQDVTVSGDGNLLFVTAVNQLSVWRVNASSGTLRESRVYENFTSDDEGRIIRSLGGVLAVAVSDDSELLFVTADADDMANDNILSVWRVNASSGTLRQTAFYKNFGLDDEYRTIRGLAEARDVAVSGDLLFVPAFYENALSVWRVNASSGTLRQTALYQDIRAPGATTIAKVDGRVDGLNGAAGVALSDDGGVLFVTALQDDTLSVWQVNASSGTLRQTALYRNNEAGVNGLDGAGSVTVSGDLLFVTVQSDNALSVWQINDAEVLFGVPVMIRVQSDMPVAGEVVVTITARNGAEMARDTVTLSPENLSEEARFAPGNLGPGRWIFTAQAQPPALLNTGAARIAMQVLAPVKLTLDVPGSVTVSDNILMVTVGVAAEMPLPEGVSVTATLSFSAGDGAEIEMKEVVLTGEQSAVTVPFTLPGTVGRHTVAARGIRSDSIVLPVIGTSSQVTVQPVLALDVPSAPIYRGMMFPVRVRLLGGLLEDNGSVAVTVYLRNAVTHALASTATVTLSTAAPSDKLSFEATPGEAAVTAYSLTTEDIDQAGLALLTRAVLSLQSAATATVLITRINADLSGNSAFDADDALLIARGLLTKNHLARSAGGLSRLGPSALPARLSELADFADISGDGGLDIIDMVLLTRNPDATVSDLQSRVNADNNPFAYLCGDSGSDACQDISSPHQNITEGIRYEAIGEVLDGLRRVPQPPILSLPSNP